MSRNAFYIMYIKNTGLFSLDFFKQSSRIVLRAS